MRLAVLRERRAGETRVAATPDTVRKLMGLGLSVAVESGAGQGAALPDEAFREAGAEIVADAAAALAGAGVVFAVQAPDGATRAALPRGSLLVCIAGAHAEPALVPALAAQGVDLAAMELLPRITRAQSMDVLSSQANLAGYRAVIEGATAFERGFPMMMTAAGTVPPARVFVIGAGVAGLQAIATARRLGAIVSATDVRPAAKEEIRSLGATYVGVEDAESAAQTGAYAREMSDAFRAKQAELMAATVAKNDLVICTALVLGRRAPVIVSEAMVAAMKPGSVIVDLAAEAGGNCAATVPGELAVTANGVKVLGWRNWPGRIAVSASALYARNLLTFLINFWDQAGGEPRLPEDDDIVRGVLLTRAGAVLHEQFAAATPDPQPVRADAPSTPASPHAPAATLVPAAAMAAGPAPITPMEPSGIVAPQPAPAAHPGHLAAREPDPATTPGTEADPTAGVSDSPTFAGRGPDAPPADRALSFMPPPHGTTPPQLFAPEAGAMSGSAPASGTSEVGSTPPPGLLPAEPVVTLISQPQPSAPTPPETGLMPDLASSAPMPGPVPVGHPASSAHPPASPAPNAAPSAHMPEAPPDTPPPHLPTVPVPPPTA